MKVAEWCLLAAIVLVGGMNYLAPAQGQQTSVSEREAGLFCDFDKAAKVAPPDLQRQGLEAKFEQFQNNLDKTLLDQKPTIIVAECKDEGGWQVDRSENTQGSFITRIYVTTEFLSTYNPQ